MWLDFKIVRRHNFATLFLLHIDQREEYLNLILWGREYVGYRTILFEAHRNPCPAILSFKGPMLQGR